MILLIVKYTQCYGIMREVAKHSTWQTSSKLWLSSITLHTNKRRQNVEWTKSSRFKLLPDKVGVRRERIRTQGMKFCCFRGRLMRGIYMPEYTRVRSRRTGALLTYLRDFIALHIQRPSSHQAHTHIWWCRWACYGGEQSRCITHKIMTNARIFSILGEWALKSCWDTKVGYSRIFLHLVHRKTKCSSLKNRGQL